MGRVLRGGSNSERSSAKRLMKPSSNSGSPNPSTTCRSRPFGSLQRPQALDMRALATGKRASSLGV